MCASSFSTCLSYSLDSHSEASTLLQELKSHNTAQSITEALLEILTTIAIYLIIPEAHKLGWKQSLPLFPGYFEDPPGLPPCSMGFSDPPAACALPQHSRFLWLRSPFMLVVGPSIKTLPQLQMVVSLALFLLRFFMFLLRFFFSFFASLSMSEFFNLEFRFAPNSGSMAEAHGATEPSPMHEPSSFPHHLCGQRKSH